MKVYVRVEITGNTLEDIRVFGTQPEDLGETGNYGEWAGGFKVFEIELED